MGGKDRAAVTLVGPRKEVVTVAIYYIETRVNGTVHMSERFSSTGLCGAALVGSIRPVAKPKVICAECEAAGQRLLAALGLDQS